MASRSHFAAPLLLAVVIALIVYVSLYPFRFAPDGPSMVEALGRLTWARAGRSEMLNNVLLYLPFGFCLALLVEPRFGRRRGRCSPPRSPVRCCRSAWSAAGLRAEMRVSSLKDLSLERARRVRRCGDGLDLARARCAHGAAVGGSARGRGRWSLTILVLWFIARLWPLLPDVGLGQLKSAVRPLFPPRIELAELAAFFVGWLVVAQAVFHLAPRQRAVDAFLIVIAIVLVGRTITTGNTLVTANSPRSRCCCRCS